MDRAAVAPIVRGDTPYERSIREALARESNAGAKPRTARRPRVTARRAVGAAPLAALTDPRAGAIATELAAATGALRRTLAWLLTSGGADPRLPLAGSAHYLKLWGIVTGGWQLARAARVCLEDQSIDAAFAATKLATAQFFALQILPEAAALDRKIVAGSASVVDFDSLAL